VIDLLSENKLILLAMGVRNGGYIRVEDAVMLYANKETAHSAIISLRARGYLRETNSIGVFRVVRAPSVCHSMGENLKQELNEKTGTPAQDSIPIEE